MGALRYLRAPLRGAVQCGPRCNHHDQDDDDDDDCKMPLLSYISVPRLDARTGRVVGYDRHDLLSLTPPSSSPACPDVEGTPQQAASQSSPASWRSFMYRMVGGGGGASVAAQQQQQRLFGLRI
jgi:hypothetical protein